ncbi:uncharacterized protein [Miscanthus floridulus]|uniref:uncharacterized protein n=1 Tax=Miscanthus floridulus TaxID=154761 RepID=UPI00345939BC
MDTFYKPIGRDRRFFIKIKNLHRFRVDMFFSVIDRQLLELNERFDEVNTELLICMASFSPIDSFAAFDKDKLVKLAGFYRNDFSSLELLHLPTQLNLYITDMRNDERFRNVRSLRELSIKLVETKKHERHKVVYRLLKLVLVLPVATASVERVFSVMNYVKNKLRNKIEDQYLNDCLVTFIEREFFLQVKDKDITNRFQTMKNRKIKATLYRHGCTAARGEDGAFLCPGFDARAHGAGWPQARVWLCEFCEHAPTAITCHADAACDTDIHSANPLALRHERLPVTPC